MANNNGNGFQLTQSDGYTTLRVDTNELDKLARIRAGQATGVVAHKYAFSTVQKDVDAGTVPRMVTEDGQTVLVRKVSLMVETQTAEQAAQKAEAKWGRGIIASLRKRTGLTKGKTPVTDTEKLSVAELQEWIDGERTVDYRTFDALPAETQSKVIALRDELVTGKPAKTPKATAMAQLSALWDAGAYRLMLEGGTIDQASYDIAEASVKAYKAQIAAVAAKAAAKATGTEQSQD